MKYIIYCFYLMTKIYISRKKLEPMIFYWKREITWYFKYKNLQVFKKYWKIQGIGQNVYDPSFYEEMCVECKFFWYYLMFINGEFFWCVPKEETNDFWEKNWCKLKSCFVKL